MRHTRSRLENSRGLFSTAVLLVAQLCASGAAAAAGLSPELEPICPFPEQLTAIEKVGVETGEAKAARHPGVSFHRTGGHDLYDDHRYTSERHRADRLSGTSRYSRASETFGEAEEVSDPRDREARKRSRDLDLQMREREPITGWTLLRDGLVSRAILEFGDRAVEEPTAAIPRVGYALARAELGDLKKGMRAMRAAFRTDAVSLHCAPLDDRLRDRIGRLVALYETDEDPTRFDPDSHFMRAALRYLIDDLSAAVSDIELAIMDGDESESTASLHRMLRQRLFAPL